MALAARVYRQDEYPHEKPAIKTRPRIVRKSRKIKIQLSRGVRTGLFTALPIVLVVTYVWLTAQLTAQTYRLHDDQALRTALTQRDNDLRQQVAKLESLPRLEDAARKLHMHVPQSVAIVAPAHVAPQHPATSIAASISGLRKWLHI
jgi:cell division protein FtsL